MHKGMNTTVDEGQTPIVTTGGVFDEATCFKPSHFTRGKDGGGYGKANDGLGITEEGTGPLQRCNTPAVAFKPGQSEEAAVSACLNGWDERHDPPKHMVAFAQNQLGEVRCNSEVMGTVNTNQNASGRNTPMVAFGTTQVTSPKNYSNPKLGDPCHPLAVGAHVPAVGFKESQSGCRESDVHATIDANKGSRRQEGVFGAMQVRRLTPKECEYLQGFPAGHTAITFRKKPAADGPRYRALGNSMAVPCMVWLGHRIQQATKGDNT